MLPFAYMEVNVHLSIFCFPPNAYVVHVLPLCCPKLKIRESRHLLRMPTAHALNYGSTTTSIMAFSVTPLAIMAEL
jgi:hypothetical protein